jgi:hypothetical protein
VPHPHVLYCSMRITHAAACSVGWWLMAGADLFWEKSTVGWLLMTDLFWEKSTAGWWLISQTNRASSGSRSQPLQQYRYCVPFQVGVKEAHLVHLGGSIWSSKWP